MPGVRATRMASPSSPRPGRGSPTPRTRAALPRAGSTSSAARSTASSAASSSCAPRKRRPLRPLRSGPKESKATRSLPRWSSARSRRGASRCDGAKRARAGRTRSSSRIRSSSTTSSTARVALEIEGRTGSGAARSGAAPGLGHWLARSAGPPQDLHQQGAAGHGARAHRDRAAARALPGRRDGGGDRACHDVRLRAGQHRLHEGPPHPGCARSPTAPRSARRPT